MRKGKEKESISAAGEEFTYRLSQEGEVVRLVAELPGISEDRIMLDLEDTTLFVSTNGKGRRYRMGIPLPWEARLGKKRFRDGVLELFLDKAAR